MRLLLENPLHNACANAKLPADLEDAVTIGPQFKYASLNRRFDSAPAQFGAVRLSTGQPRVDPFLGKRH